MVVRTWAVALVVLAVPALGAVPASGAADPVAGPVAPAPAGSATGPDGCRGDRWVASWAAAPTDAIVPVDAAGTAAPTVLHEQSVRMVLSPHLGGDRVRVRLSNRFGSFPVTFGAATVAHQRDGATTGPPVGLTFSGRRQVTVPAGQDVVSDPAPLRVVAFERLAVSTYLPGATVSVTKHWNANATSFYSASGAGDVTARTDAAAYRNRTYAWLFVTGVDVVAPAPVRGVVAFGDSITDGFVSGSPLSIPVDPRAVDDEHRYPDVLQRRLAAAGVPVSVVNAGIGSNMVTTGGTPLMIGPSGRARFRADALGQAGVGGVLIQEGINDLGLVRAAPEQLIAGLADLVAQAHAAGARAWLGTLLPSAGAIVNGTATAPDSERARQRVNAWIRGQDVADGVVDFDAALRDPADPSNLRPEYASVDRLHPSPAGYRAMAAAVDPALLATARCRS